MRVRIKEGKEKNERNRKYERKNDGKERRMTGNRER